MKILIIGAGGHAAVVADILLTMRETGADVEPIGLVDDEPSLYGTQVAGLPVLGDLDVVHETEADALIVAIGDNSCRRRITTRLSEHGARFATARHARAVVARDVAVGEGAMFCAGAVVNAGTVVGRGVILNTSASLDHHNTVGDFAHIAPGVHTGGDVHIGDGCLIGIGATVMPGCRIGRGATVGAGSLVIADVAAGETVVGAPAKPIVVSAA